MSLSRYFKALASMSLLFMGCPDPQADLSSLASSGGQNVQFNGTFLNGTFLNGTFLNGTFVNGTFLNGTFLNGTFVNGTFLNGTFLNGTFVNGTFVNGTALDAKNFSIINSQLFYRTESGKKLSGQDLRGITANFKFTDPATNKSTMYSLRIESVTLDTTNRFKDVWLYQVSYKIDNNKQWQSLCTDYEGKASPLVPVLGSYWSEQTGARTDDPKAFTLACIEGAIGKCVTMGYRPWANGTIGRGCSSDCDNDRNDSNCNVVSLKDYHQACTRMLRADYCGDGTSYTVNGTILDVYDYLNPNIQSQEERWLMEARWKPEGALCVSQRRHPEIDFPGCNKNRGTDKPPAYVQPPKCQPYSQGDSRGLVVSTFRPPR